MLCSDKSILTTSDLPVAKASFIEALATGKSDFVKIDLSEQSIKIYGKTAVVRHKLIAETNDGGKPATVKLSILYVWQKQGGKWQMVARQAVKFT